MLLPAHRAVLTGGTRALMRRNLAAAFDAALGITSSGGFASAWADQSGNARHLLQATGANQPIHLPFAGTKYAVNFGVAGNSITTPDKEVSSGDMAVVVKAAADDWTPASLNMFFAKDGTGGNRDWGLYQDAAAVGSKLTLYWFEAGGAGKTAASTINPTVLDGETLSVAATLDVDDGAGNHVVKFWQSSDDWATKTQIGTTITTAGVTNVRRTSASIYVMNYGSGGALFGKVFTALAYAGIPAYLGGAGSETLKVDFNPNRDYVSGGTFVSSTTGETYTINSTGSKPAQIVDRPSLLFDGAAHYMKTAPFTLNQPETVYLVAKQVSWTISDQMTDGDTSGTMRIFQDTTTPNLGLYAGSLAATNGNLAVGATGVICAQFNGANSLLQINQTAAVAGNAGASNAGGFTLGATAAPGNYTNIQAYEALIYNVAHDAATRANVIRALMSKHGVA